MGHDFTVKDQSSTYFRAAADCNYGTRYWHKCSRCPEKSTTSDYQVGNALGHSPGAAATCTTNQTCTRCGSILATALGHNFTGAAATCTQSESCKRCGMVVVPALGCNSLDNPNNHYCLNCFDTDSFGEGASVLLGGGHHTIKYCIRCNSETDNCVEGHSFEIVLLSMWCKYCYYTPPQTY